MVAIGRSLLIFGNVSRPYWIFSCDQAALLMVFSVRLSVCLSVCPSVTPFYPSALWAGGVLSSRSGWVGGQAGSCQTCGTHISETAGWIYTIRSSMELSRPVVVQHHGHLTLTLDFQGQILKMLYLRNGKADWHGAKEMWVDRILDPHCDFELWPRPWPWPLIFKVKFQKSRNSGTGCPIGMERKECESIGY